MRISASIIVFNEERHIAALCDTLSWADEIVIVDSNSTDRTVEIARRFTDKVFQHEFKGYKDKHEFADSKTSGDWIFWIDADERVTDELRRSIEDVRRREESTLPDGFRIARKAFYLGKFIRYCGWYPDFQMRLYRKSASAWGGIAPHETARVRGRIETLHGELLHFTKDSLSEHLRVMDSYSALAAEHHFRRATRVGGVRLFLRLLLHPIVAFLRTYILKQGFRDGVAGLIISTQTAYGVFLKYAKVWEKGIVGQ
jgi:glycosyltransferase involved in cell wall biosynthesis